MVATGEVPFGSRGAQIGAAMRYLALACDYDGTLAAHGVMDDATVDALRRVRASGRALVLVTGRRLAELVDFVPHLDVFDRVVAENGGVLYRPANGEQVALAEPPPQAFVQALEAEGVTPLLIGTTIVATWQPHETTVLETIRDLGLELQVIFNKGAVMVLPSGVNKASGLDAALAELELSPHNAVGIGDAENDHAFLSRCECAVAVANALPALRDRCDWVTRSEYGAGVVELIDALLADDLSALARGLTRHHLLLGRRGDEELRLPPVGVTALLAGPSGSGKSTLAGGLLERIAAAGYQFCVIDPEGVSEVMAGAIVLGDRERAPSIEELLELLRNPAQHVIVNLLGLAAADRPRFFEALQPRLHALRACTGRPHWIVVDEADQMLRAAGDRPATPLQAAGGTLLITAHPERVASAILESVDTVLAVGHDPAATLRAVPGAARAAATVEAGLELPTDEALAWSTHLGESIVRFTIVPPDFEQRRHLRPV